MTIEPNENHVIYYDGVIGLDLCSLIHYFVSTEKLTTRPCDSTKFFEQVLKIAGIKAKDIKFHNEQNIVEVNHVWKSL